MNSTKDIGHYQPNHNSTELDDHTNGNCIGDRGKRAPIRNHSQMVTGWDHIYSKGEIVYTHGAPKRHKSRSKISKSSKRKNRKKK